MFQRQVNVQPAPAIEGDFASANPRFSVLAGPGNLIAGPAGVRVGRFAWAVANASQDFDSGIAQALHSVSNSGSGAPTGFVHREQQGLLTTFLQEAGMIVPQGLPIILHSGGDFWARNASAANNVTLGQRCYANNHDGSVLTGAAQTVGAALTTTTIVANVLNVSNVAPNVFVGGIADTTLTVSGITTGLVFPNQSITGTNIAPGTTVSEQLTGAVSGGAGTYRVSIGQNVAAGTVITGSGGCLTVTSLTSGRLIAGQVLAGGTNPVAAGTTILAGGTGQATGVAGTYPVSISQTCANTATATATGGYLTVIAMTAGGLVSLNDEIVGVATPAGTIVQGDATTNPGVLTGLGLLGTYMISSAVGAADIVNTIYANTATKWFAQSNCGPGELFKMSDHVLG